MTRYELALKAELESSLMQDARGEQASLSPSDVELGLARVETGEVQQRELVLAAMKLRDHDLAQSALRGFVARTVTRILKTHGPGSPRHVVTLAELYAATVLSLVDDRSGVPILRSVGTLTNSQIEFFYARGALTLLRESIPLNLAERRSVFRQREDLIDACHRASTDES